MPCDAAYAAYDAYMNDVRAKGEEMIEQARRRRPPHHRAGRAARITSIPKSTTASTS